MLLIEAKKIKKDFGDRVLFTIDTLMIYKGDRVGIVGLNGMGKTTLMNILAGEDKAYQGYVKRYSTHAYIKQLDESFNLLQLSGGERTRLKIDDAFNEGAGILFADEPTSNLDFRGIELLEKQLGAFEGAMILISHDRRLLDQFCNRVIEIENGRIKEYKGNYSHYIQQKNEAYLRSQFEFDAYVKEKKRLHGVKDQVVQRSKTMSKTPKRMGNSEARLHKGGVNSKKAKLDKAAKAIESRIQQLEVKEKPATIPKSKLDLLEEQRLYSKVVIRLEDVSHSFPHKALFNQINFEIHKGDKIALMGNNGCGKTTLINLIMNQGKGITIAKGAKIGYFHQDLQNLKEDNTILENIMESSIYSETLVRILLARLLFKREDVYKPVRVLSGGERVKVQLAKLFTSDFNLLILDEPGNYLDVYSLEALEKVLTDYDGTLLFVSHDRLLVDKVATKLFIIENQHGIYFQGNYSEYKQWVKEGNQKNQSLKLELLKLETQLSELIGKISMPTKNDDVAMLDCQYHEVIEQIKNYKKRMGMK